MSNINSQIKDAAAPSVLLVIEWAKKVHDDTMEQMNKPSRDLLAERRYTEDEREEARTILLEYGAGKPTRIVEHRGNKKKPICFETEVVGRKQLPEAPYLDAEVVTSPEAINEAANT
jgi:hypothetical protein